MWDVKYRPLRFSDVLGQEGAVKVLQSRLSKGTACDTSYIFCGGAGRGKTTLARILGRALLCQKLTPDFEPCNECDNCRDALSDSSTILAELDAASRGTIEHAREIVDSLAFGVQGASKRIYILDEVHRMGAGAQDVLLKPIEDKQLVCIFCTTEPEKIRGPIRSRCEEYKIRRITRDDVLARMAWVLQQERVEFESEAVLTVIDHSGGHVRDVLNRLEMIAQLGPVTLEAVREHLNLSAVTTYYQALLALGNPAEALRLTEEACDRVGPEEVAEGLAEAAMNAYRLAHKMEAPFSHFDRDLATKLYAAYGDNTLRLAEYFLRAYRVSKMALLGDILACQAGIPAQRTEAPVVINLVSPAQTPQIQAASAVPAPIQAAPVVPAPTQAAPSPQVAKVTPSIPPPPKSDRKGVGNLNSGDPEALTSLDTVLVPKTLPRGHAPVALPKVTSSATKELFVTAPEWKAEFRRQLEAVTWGSR